LGRQRREVLALEISGDLLHALTVRRGSLDPQRPLEAVEARAAMRFAEMVVARDASSWYEPGS
jgi:hypothetical protein